MRLHRWTAGVRSGSELTCPRDLRRRTPRARTSCKPARNWPGTSALDYVVISLGLPAAFGTPAPSLVQAATAWEEPTQTCPVRALRHLPPRSTGASRCWTGANAAGQRCPRSGRHDGSVHAVRGLRRPIGPTRTSRSPLERRAIRWLTGRELGHQAHESLPCRPVLLVR